MATILERDARSTLPGNLALMPCRLAFRYKKNAGGERLGAPSVCWHLAAEVRRCWILRGGPAAGIPVQRVLPSF